MTEDKPKWSAYYDATSARQPSPLFVDAVARFDSVGKAIDLGCGAGVESLELLRQGWKVLAVDKEADAVEHLRARVPGNLRHSLETKVASFEEVNLPSADFVWAKLSLSFCRPDSFKDLWAKVVGCLNPGGRVACDLFGVRHRWSSNPDMTFVDEREVDALLEPLDVELLVEQEEERQTVFDGMQHWHAHVVIARKR